MKKWLVPVLCALPFVGVGLWFLAGKNLGSVATIGLILACPLLHLLFMRHDGHSGHRHNGKGGG